MVFFFFWVFCTSLPNQVEHTRIKFQLQICKYEWARIQIVMVTLKVMSCITMSKKKSEKKWKTKILWAKQTIFWKPCPSALGSFSHMAACRSSLENTWKMSLIIVFNKNSPHAHMELELGMLGVHGKLVKYVVHLFKRKNWFFKIFLHTSCPNSNRPIFGLKEF
jgi:hypothetical protein